MCARALIVLGAAVKPAIPSLIQGFCYSHNWYSRHLIGEVLGGLGADALPQLLQSFSDPKFSNYLAAVYVIGEMRTVGDAGIAAVPVLCRYLQGNDESLGIACADTLGTLGVAPALAVPALVNALTNALQAGDVLLSRKCAEALGKFRGNSSNAVPVLCAALDSADGITTEEAARAVGQIGTDASIAVPALLKYLRREKRHRKYAIEGLSGYGAAAREAIPALQETLLHEDHDTRALAAELLLKLTQSQ